MVPRLAILNLIDFITETLHYFVDSIQRHDDNMHGDDSFIGETVMLLDCQSDPVQAIEHYEATQQG